MSLFKLPSDAFIFLLNALPMHEVLKLRLLCKTTNDVILQYLYGGQKTIPRPLEIDHITTLVRRHLSGDQTFRYLVREARMFVQVYSDPDRRAIDCTEETCFQAAATALTMYKGREWALGYVKQPPAWVTTDNDTFSIMMAAWLRLGDTVELWCLAGHSPRQVRHAFLGDMAYAAAYNNDAFLMRLLIGHRVDVMSTTGYFGDAFKLAAYKGSTRVVHVLLESRQHLSAAQARSNRSQGLFGCALGAAAAAGEFEAVRMLLPHRNNRYIYNEFLGKSPLYLAAQHGQIQIVNVLLSCPDIDPNSGRHTAETPLAAALAVGHAPVVTALVNRPNVRILPAQHLAIRKLLRSIRQYEDDSVSAGLGQ
ncbi:ankyrin [Aspergillus sclerotiicarbonarius CBS 121057]|uniref:Ankyrin n=1 Tax=Aspergillus sclerotiicarbonarius (strain CBS 121057 / IBT 28362) TaxID=1448318 RepID=A0A319DY35_ASPSB|nr:ankyrin [Aspergillus sclerotiicarbonarius CBS 121057]